MIIWHWDASQMTIVTRGGWMIDQTSKTETEPMPKKRQQQHARKPWRTPVFIESDIMSTDTMCQAGTDGPGLS